MPTLTIAGIVTMPSSTNGATFWRHDRRMPSARRIDALYSANVAAPRRPRGPSYGPVAAVVDRAAAARRSSDGSRHALGAAQEHFVERREAGREAVERELELGDDVAEQVEAVVAVDLDLDDAVDGDRRQVRGAERGDELLAGADRRRR